MGELAGHLAGGVADVEHSQPFQGAPPVAGVGVELERVVATAADGDGQFGQRPVDDAGAVQEAPGPRTAALDDVEQEIA